MGQRIEQIAAVVTPTDAMHGGVGIIAVLNGVWFDFLNPVVQIGLTIGGAIYLYYMVRAKRMEWKLKRLEYEEKATGGKH